MHLIQILLPLSDSRGRPFDRALYRDVTAELTRRFGGLTAYSRAPAQGVWVPDPTTVSHDDIVVIEVMVHTVDRDWWDEERSHLEALFGQEEVVIRSWPMERL